MTKCLEFEIDSLVTRGMAHELRCEDDALVYEDERIVAVGVFDGCSSGIDSHVASTWHKRWFGRLIEHNSPVPKYVKDTKVLFDRTMLQYMDMSYENGKEMLSTVLICVVEKATGDYSILVTGDGYVRTPEVEESIHDPNGNEVWYMSSLRMQPYDECERYYNDYCRKYHGTLEDGQEIMISTDGIESFLTGIGAKANEFARDVFIHPETLGGKFVNMPLIRRYRLATNGKLPYLNGEKIRNYDDFSMVVVKVRKKDESIEGMEGQA